MSVDVTQVRYSMKEPTRDAWLNQRTISMRGNDGSNMEHDRGMEKFNLACAEATRGHVTREGLAKFCRQMNALSWVETRFRKPSTWKVTASPHAATCGQITWPASFSNSSTIYAPRGTSSLFRRHRSSAALQTTSLGSRSGNFTKESAAGSLFGNT